MRESFCTSEYIFNRQEIKIVEECKSKLYFVFQHVKRILNSVNKDTNKHFISDLRPIEKWAHKVVDQVYLRYLNDPVLDSLTGTCIFRRKINPLHRSIEEEINEIISELKREKKNERVILCS